MDNASKLSYYYGLRDEYTEKKDTYNIAKNLCSSLIDEMNKYKNTLSKINDSLASSFTINGEPADDGMTGQLIDAAASIISSLSGILDQINTEISQLTNKISECNSEIQYLSKLINEEKNES